MGSTRRARSQRTTKISPTVGRLRYPTICAPPMLERPPGEQRRLLRRPRRRPHTRERTAQQGRAVYGQRRAPSRGSAVIGLSAVVVALGVFSASASAHSFLIRSLPEAGARVTRAPSTMTLHFSEPFLAGSQRVQIRRTDGHAVELPRPQGAGLVIDQPLPPDLRGVFLVSWRVVSDDGHVSLGEFAFAAGSSAAVPKIATGSQSTRGPMSRPAG